MNKLIFKCPINSVSFGNVSINIMRELFKKELSVSHFPIGQFDASVYDKINNEFKEWLQTSSNNRFKTLDKNSPTVQLWHINGSENRITKESHLITFYEVDEPTESEKNIVNIHDSVMFSSSYAAKIFKSIGCENVKYLPIGFDPDFHRTDKKYLEGKIHFGLMGKFEKRKHNLRCI